MGPCTSNMQLSPSIAVFREGRIHSSALLLLEQHNLLYIWLDWLTDILWCLIITKNSICNIYLLRAGKRFFYSGDEPVIGMLLRQASIDIYILKIFGWMLYGIWNTFGLWFPPGWIPFGYQSMTKTQLQFQPLTWYGFLVECDLHRVHSRLVRSKTSNETLVSQGTHRRGHTAPVDQNFQISGPGLGTVN